MENRGGGGGVILHDELMFVPDEASGRFLCWAAAASLPVGRTQEVIHLCNHSRSELNVPSAAVSYIQFELIALAPFPFPLKLVI